MVELTIGCHPCAPVSVQELERWLELLGNNLRTDLPHASVRLSRLTQTLPSADLDVGWLIELGFPEREARRASDRLIDVFRECDCWAFRRRYCPDTTLALGAGPASRRA